MLLNTAEETGENLMGTPPKKKYAEIQILKKLVKIFVAIMQEQYLGSFV